MGWSVAEVLTAAHPTTGVSRLLAVVLTWEQGTLPSPIAQKTRGKKRFCSVFGKLEKGVLLPRGGVETEVIHFTIPLQDDRGRITTSRENKTAMQESFDLSVQDFSKTFLTPTEFPKKKIYKFFL